MNLTVGAIFFFISALIVLFLSLISIKFARKYIKKIEVNSDLTRTLSLKELLSASLFVFLLILATSAEYFFPNSWIAGFSESYQGKATIVIAITALFQPIGYIMNRYVWFDGKK